jgi:serine/threonine-protein kinase
MGDEASTTRPSATERQSAPDERDPVGARSSPWVPVVVVLALGGAGALYWQLRSIGPAPVEGQSSGAAAGPAASGSPARSRNAGRASTHPSASQQPSGQQAAAPADGGPPDAAGVTIGDAGSDAAGDGSDGGSGDAGAAAASPPGPPEGMVYIAPPPGREAGAGPGHFFIDRAEVSTAAYRECVMAGRCPKATRVVLTDEAARALVGGLAPDATAPEQLASAWGRRCNAVREALDHPVNCVSSASAEDYCAWRRKRLPTSAEWTLAAAGAVGRRYPWGEQAPECDFACYGLNGTCVARAKEVASCAGGSHDRDATGDGVTDLAGNLAEWVSDQSPEQSAGGPPWRVLRGGSFLDEAAGLVTTTARAAPPVTAYVSIGFRCAKDVPAAGTGVR